VDPALNPAPINVPALLREHGLSPRKGLGQNFLIDSAALRKLVEAAEVEAQSDVLEIGPGVGSLTAELARSAGRVTAVEIDANLIPVLRQVLATYPNVHLVHGDILEIDLDALQLTPGYLVVANIPYYITSAIIRRLLEAPVRPARMVLTMQREVAARICAEPGEMSLLALSVQVYGKPQPVLRLPAGAFYPPPNVDSVSLRVDLYPQPVIPAEHLADFFQLIKAGFAQKRKTLRNTLSAGLSWPTEKTGALLAAAEIDPQRRAETLALPEWERLTRQYRAMR
jgi:16S rRNA (adenine1518-N6/adenine1519-N6)-dimethyltransferase